ncbi:MAG TPA: FecR family protein [Candidatus Acidoferrales bacterium]|jgi:hypothetical protein|nr:FecR family protein [Candidatus Acidoferrales bacterium]
MKRAQHVLRIFAALLICGSLGLAVSPSARAQQEDQENQDTHVDLSNVRIVRLSFVEGEVQFQREGEDWQAASMNLPVQEGYKLATGNGRAEIEFESGLIVRLADNSELDFTQLALLNGGKITQLTLASGTAIVSASLDSKDALSIVAPNLQVGVSHTTRFRVDTSQGDSWVTVMKGDVAVNSGAGDSRVTSGHTLHISAANPDQINVDKSAEPDDFDNWAADRDSVLQQENSEAMEAFQANEASTLDYMNNNSGLADLYGYGSFVSIAGYGMCWQPYGISARWQPFWNGEMVYVPGFGWTWVSNEPWGWLPYHTGHWFYVSGRGWIWQLGPVREWNPAPVRWVRAGNQIGWMPRGVSAMNDTPGGPWVVTGGENSSGRIRPVERLRGGPVDFSNGAPPVAPLPVARAHQPEPRTPGSPASNGFNSPANGHERGPIHLDPRTDTYENDNPPVRPIRTAPLSKPEGSTATGQPPAATNNSGNQTVPPRQTQQQPPLPQRQPAPAPAPPHYSPPPAPPHYSPPPSPPPQHSSPPAAPHSAPPASHGGGGGSSAGSSHHR